ncbi:MAG: tetratricopeptide repeat-containing diguanylate cyclase [Paraglaciecola sp.]|uniref:tetratricopeptide repeat-containing diguanylate cyclase n=1 Tax=Paraglaciecola sp. TaxID=1920173 RepID=UPI003299DB09
MLRCLILFSWLVFAATAKSQHTQIMEFSSPFVDYATILVNSPQEVIDKLSNDVPNKNQPDIIHTQHHLFLSRAYYNLAYPQKSLNHARTALNFVSEKQQPWLYHNCKIAESDALELIGNPAQAMEGVNSAVVWAKRNQQSKLYLQALYSRGIIQTSLPNYVAALNDFQQAYSLASNDPNELSKAHVASMLAQVYEYRREYDLAIPFYEEAVTAHRLNGADLELSIALYGLGRANRGIDKLELGKAQLRESLQLAEKIDDLQGVGYALKELASIDIQEENYLEAEIKLKKAASIFEQADNPQMNFILNMLLTELALDTKKIAEAEIFFQQATTLFNRNSMLIHASDYDVLQARLLYEQAQFKVAYETLKQAFENHKEQQNSESTRQLHQLRSGFEMQLTQQENAVLSQKNSLQRLQLKDKKNQNVQLFLSTAFATIVCGLLGIIVFRNKAHKRNLVKLATRDDLTGLYNRRHTLTLLEQQMLLSNRYGNSLCIAMLDLDFFKEINDSYGHVAGDKVLQEFALLCKQNLRESDVIGRIGGEEFLLILSHTNSIDGFKVADSLRTKMSTLSHKVGLPECKVTLSIGIVEYSPNDSIENFMLLADTALYRAKNNGRDQVVVYERDSSSETSS